MFESLNVMHKFPENIPVYVMHVKAAVQREDHIRKELEQKAIPFEFVLEGDMIDLNPIDINKYFRDEMGSINPMSSCTFKHFKAYERFLKGNFSFALMLEDDIELSDNFNAQIPKITHEIQARGLKQFIISLENSTLKRIPSKEKIENQLLYKRSQGRCAGAYIIDRAGAESLIQYAIAEKCPHVIDWYHNLMSNLSLISIYWLDPPIAEQGSHNGKMPSLIDNKRTGWFKEFSFKLRKIFKGIN